MLLLWFLIDYDYENNSIIALLLYQIFAGLIVYFGVQMLLHKSFKVFNRRGWLGAALLILCYYRSLSRNISKRTEENYRFYSLKDRFSNKFHSLKEQWANRKLYHYYRCPQCRQKLRVPRGRGRIQISCPRCGTQFIKKS